ncbi:MAG: CsiV family protein [Povalibacter sp.]
MIKRLLKVAAIVASALVVGSAAGQQTGLQSYDVELIVFRNLSGSGTAEDWVTESGIPAQSIPTTDDESDTAGAAVESAPLPTAMETFPPLATTKFKLDGIAETLRRSRSYQPLAHFGWTQPGFPRGEAHYMAIDALANTGSGLTGRVALARGRYLHLTLDLALQPAGSAEHYFLRQTRRMRSTERHYIDHPKFGVIAVITPSGAQ